MKVWIDLSNSPHPLLFAPIAARLEGRDAEIVVTARDNAQTVELARATWPGCEVIGGESPAGRLSKARTLAERVAGLRAWARAERPDVALSHNSYAQIVAARSLRVPVVTAMDFEHQPVNHLAFRLAQRVLLPDAFPERAAREQGARSRKVVRYSGLKESIYLGDFEPDAAIVERLGASPPPGGALAVARTPPSRATYHRFGNALFDACLRELGGRPEVRCVVLTRHPEQLRVVRELGLANLVAPAQAIDSRALIYEADLVLGAGGTMTREAALMGVPTVSVFAGRVPAVDRWLEGAGRLRRIDAASEIANAGPRERPPDPVEALRAQGERLVDRFAEAVFC